MALELNSIPAILEVLNKNLQYEYEIRNNLTSLVAEGRLVSEYFVMAIRNQGGAVMQQIKRLEIASASDIDVVNLKKTLEEFSCALCNAEGKALVMKKHTNDSIELLRDKMRTIDRDIAFQNIEFKRLTERVENLKTEIRILEHDADASEEEERKLRQSARDLRNGAEEKRRVGAGTSLLVLGASLAFAPLTGGASLIIGGATASANLGMHLIIASRYEEDAEKYKNKAEDERRKALGKKEDVTRIQDQISSHRSDISTLQRKQQELKNATRDLEEVTGHLRGALTTIHKATIVVQDFEKEVLSADLQTDKFRIIQTAFLNHRDKLKGFAQQAVIRLWEKWQNVRAVIIEVCPQAAIN